MMWFHEFFVINRATNDWRTDLPSSLLHYKRGRWNTPDQCSANKRSRLRLLFHQMGWKRYRQTDQPIDGRTRPRVQWRLKTEAGFVYVNSHWFLQKQKSSTCKFSRQRVAVGRSVHDSPVDRQTCTPADRRIGRSVHRQTVYSVDMCTGRQWNRHTGKPGRHGCRF